MTTLIDDPSGGELALHYFAMASIVWLSTIRYPGDPMITFSGLNHIHLAVRDLDRSIAFYRGAFGLVRQFEAGPDLVFVSTPGASDSIALHAVGSQAGKAGTMGGIAHFGFRLADRSQLDAAIKGIVSAGGRLIERGEHEPGHPFAYFADPDGYVIEI
jgi:catechol 2,3-dioxygenase-like lactoylglutathione lyase family enzyme